MHINFKKFRVGDTVCGEFASPAKGWIEAEVVDLDLDLIQLAMGSGDPSAYVPSDFSSIRKIEPLVQFGDAVWFDGEVWIAKPQPLTGDTVLVNFTDSESYALFGLPANAVWLVRGGKLNPALVGDLRDEA